ncbi:MAG: hypothetical protein LBT53_03605 [Puniceicoccales bacterium]|jgi:hypothetical protein|nr:hypothetical protein [Puniceicoccales bacterium]
MKKDYTLRRDNAASVADGTLAPTAAFRKERTKLRAALVAAATVAFGTLATQSLLAQNASQTPPDDTVRQQTPPTAPSANTRRAPVRKQAAPTNADEERNWFVDGGLLIYASDITAVGFNFRGGYYLRPEDRLVLDIGVGFDVDPKVTGHFSYRPVGGGAWHYDGKIQINHTIVPVLFAWEHEWQLSDNWSWRLGPTIGFASISGKEERSPHVVNASNVFRSASGAAGLLGVSAGVHWNFAKTETVHWYADLSLTALGATDVKLKALDEKVNLSGARIGLSVGARF